MTTTTIPNALKVAPPGLYGLGGLADQVLIDWGSQLREERDDHTWGLADLCKTLFDRYPQTRKAGRPPEGYDGLTKTELATQWGVRSQWLSELDLTASFWPHRMRRAGDYATFAHHDSARRFVCGDDKLWMDDPHRHRRLLARAYKQMRVAGRERLTIDPFRDHLKPDATKSVVVYSGAWLAEWGPMPVELANRLANTPNQIGPPEFICRIPVQPDK